MSQDKIESKTAQMPQVYRPVYKRAMTGKSRVAAVKAFCLECVGHARKEITLCTSPACPLYPYRPYKSVRQRAESVASLGTA